MEVVRMAEAAPEFARALRAVYRVSHAARTREQRVAAATAMSRWTVLALRAGWTRPQVAEAARVSPAAVDRARRHPQADAAIPDLCGVLAVPKPPRSELAGTKVQRQRLIGSAEVARLVGCRPRSVKYWTSSRGVPHEWTSGGAKRLYDRSLIVAAAASRPTQRHDGWQRRRNVAVPPQLRAEAGGATTRPMTPAGV